MKMNNATNTNIIKNNSNEQTLLKSFSKNNKFQSENKFHSAEEQLIQNIIKVYNSKLTEFEQQMDLISMNENEPDDDKKSKLVYEIHKKSLEYKEKIVTNVQFIFNDCVKKFTTKNTTISDLGVCQEAIRRIHEKTAEKEFQDLCELKIEYLKEVKDDTKTILEFIEKNRSEFDYDEKEFTKDPQKYIVSNPYTIGFIKEFNPEFNTAYLSAIQKIIQDYNKNPSQSSETSSEISSNIKILLEEKIEDYIKDEIKTKHKIDIKNISDEEAAKIVKLNDAHLKLLPKKFLQDPDFILSITRDVTYNYTLTPYEGSNKECYFICKYAEKKVNYHPDLLKTISQLFPDDSLLKQLAQKNVLLIDKNLFAAWEKKGAGDTLGVLTCIVINALKQGVDLERLPLKNHYKNILDILCLKCNEQEFEIKVSPRDITIEKHDKQSFAYTQQLHLIRDLVSNRSIEKWADYVKRFKSIQLKHIELDKKKAFRALIQQCPDYAKTCPLDILNYPDYCEIIYELMETDTYVHLARDLEGFYYAFRNQIDNDNNFFSKAISANGFLFVSAEFSEKPDKPSTETHENYKKISVINLDKVYKKLSTFVDEKNISNIYEQLPEVLLFLKNYKFTIDLKDSDDPLLKRFNSIYEGVLKKYLEYDGMGLKYALEEYKDTIEYVSTATGNCVHAIQFASKKIRGGITHEAQELLKELLNITLSVAKYINFTTHNVPFCEYINNLMKEKKKKILSEDVNAQLSFTSRSTLTNMKYAIGNTLGDKSMLFSLTSRLYESKSVMVSVYSKITDKKEKEQFANEYQSYLKEVDKDPLNYFKLPTIFKKDPVILKHVLLEKGDLFNESDFETRQLILSDLELMESISDNDEIWQNKKFLKLALQYNGLSYQFVQGPAKYDIDLVLTALKNKPDVYDLLSEELQQHDAIKSCMERAEEYMITRLEDGYDFGKAPECFKSNPRVVKYALKIDPLNIKYVNQKIEDYEEYIKNALQDANDLMKKGEIDKKVNKSEIPSTEEQLEILMRENIWRKGNYWIKLDILKSYPFAIKFIQSSDSNYDEYVKTALKNDGLAIEGVDKKIREDSQNWLIALKSNIKVYDIMPEEIKKHKEITIHMEKYKGKNVSKMSESVLTIMENYDRDKNEKKN